MNSVSVDEVIPDVFIICYWCGFKQSIETLQDKTNYLCNECKEKEDKPQVDLSILDNDNVVDLSMLDF